MIQYMRREKTLFECIRDIQFRQGEVTSENENTVSSGSEIEEISDEMKVERKSFPFLKLDSNDQIYQEIFNFKFAVASDGGCKKDKASAAILFELDGKLKTIKKKDELRTTCGPATKAQLLEVLAVKNAIELIIKNKLIEHEIAMIIDSSYAASKVAEIFSWKEKEFKKYDGSPAKHIETWKEIYNLINEHQLQLHVIKVKSHTNFLLNDLADGLANQGGC
uniref:RNase H domain-containing protein n=1 Tax=Strongyloides papillosus TaxID=174720 RepID=A0A0N5BDL6_STREA